MSEKSKNNYSVYYHYNKLNGKYYVGITMQEPHKRWNHGNGYRGNPHFWHAIQRDGWDNFEHVVVESGLSKEMAVSLEKRLIVECDSYGNGYNNSHGGESTKGYGMAQATKDKISKANSGENGYWYGKKLPLDMVKRIAEKHINHPSCSRKINQYDLDGNYIKTFPSVREVERTYGVGVAKALRGDTRQFHGFQWRYLDDVLGKENIGIYHHTTTRFKPVVCYNLKGEKIKVYNHAYELEEDGFKESVSKNIFLVCSLKRKTSHGFIWRYFNPENAIGDVGDYYDIQKAVYDIEHPNLNRRPLSQFDLEGNLINHFDSLWNATNAVGSRNKNGISMVCNGKKQTALGYVWCYDDDIESLPVKLEFANRKVQKRRVERYTLDGEYIDSFSGVKPAIKYLGSGVPSVIHACCFGMIPEAYGYIWKYANEVAG